LFDVQEIFRSAMRLAQLSRIGVGSGLAANARAVTDVEE
jgi:hypothetical protein